VIEILHDVGHFQNREFGNLLVQPTQGFLVRIQEAHHHLVHHLFRVSQLPVGENVELKLTSGKLHQFFVELCRHLVLDAGGIVVDSEPHYEGCFFFGSASDSFFTSRGENHKYSGSQ